MSDRIEQKIDTLTTIVETRFGVVEGLLDRGFAATADDIADLDHKITSLRASTESGFLSLREEIADITAILNTLEENYKNLKGVTKEIDDVRRRVGNIEKHLGIDKKIPA